jgi:hypothetical protein
MGEAMDEARFKALTAIFALSAADGTGILLGESFPSQTHEMLSPEKKGTSSLLVHVFKREISSKSLKRRISRLSMILGC